MKPNVSPSHTLLARWWPLVALFLVLALGYSPALLVNYGHTDDFITLSGSKEADLLARDGLIVSLGRPLTALVTDWSFTMADTIDGLRYLRAAGLVGVLFFVVLAERFLARKGYGSTERFSIALVLGTLPGVAIYVLWTVCFPYGYAAALAFAGGWLALAKPQRRARVWLRYGAGALLMVISLSIYQPAALFAILPALLEALRPSSPNTQKSFPAALASLLVVAVSLGLYFVLYRLALTYIFTNVTSRSGLNLDFVVRAVYLWREVIPDLFYEWAYFFGKPVRQAVGILVLVVLAVSLGRVFFRDRRLALSAAVIVLFALSLASVPAVLPAEAYVPYRVSGPLQAIVWVGVILAISSLLRWRWPRCASFTAILIALVFAGACFFVGVKFFIRPNAQELAQLREAVSEIDHYPERLIFVIPGKRLATSGLSDSKWQFAQRSGSAFWYAPGVLPLLMEEKFPSAAADFREKQKRLEVIQVWNRFEGRSGGMPVIDIYPDENEWLPELEGPFDAMRLPEQYPAWYNRYRYSPWFGFFLLHEGEPNNRWLEHVRLGSIAYTVEDKQIWLHLPEMGWVMTSKDFFPWVWQKSSEEWFEIDFSDPQQVRYVPQTK